MSDDDDPPFFRCAKNLYIYGTPSSSSSSSPKTLLELYKVMHSILILLCITSDMFIVFNIRLDFRLFILFYDSCIIVAPSPYTSYEIVCLTKETAKDLSCMHTKV